MPPKKEPQFKPNIVDFLAKRDFLFEMEPAVRKEFLSQVAQIVNQPAFLRIINDFENTAACAGIMDAVENAKVASTVNIIEAIKQKFISLASLFESETRGKEEHDPHEAI